MLIFSRNGLTLRACVCVFSFYKTRQNELIEVVIVDGVWRNHSCAAAAVIQLLFKRIDIAHF